MAEMSMDWFPADPLLEPLRPLSPEILDQKEFQNLGIDVENLTRSEIAGKLLAHLDELHQEETEPFDWYSNEKSIDIPTFDPIPSPTAYKPESTIKEVHNYAFTNNSLKYDSTTLPPANGYDTTQLPLKYTSQPAQYEFIDKNIASSAQQSSGAVVPDFEFECLKTETLTPPDSPKDDDLYELLKTFEPAVIEQLMAGADEFESNEFDGKPLTSDATCDNNSFSADESPESGGSSPYGVSDSGLDDQEWTPPSSVRRASRCSRNDGDAGASRKRAAKPYSKPPVEERKLRKKEQNKNAATRYRLKKKAEIEEIKLEEKKLQEENKKLKNKLEDISREVRCMKSLMRDVYRKKADELTDGDDSSLEDVSDGRYEHQAWTPSVRLLRVSYCDTTTGSSRRINSTSRVEERKQRKREQNKNAATRYRLKKRTEYEKIKSKEVKLQTENRKLKRQLKDIVEKIGFLKLSMRQLYC